MDQLESILLDHEFPAPAAPSVAPLADGERASRLELQKILTAKRVVGDARQFRESVSEASRLDGFQEATPLELFVDVAPQNQRNVNERIIDIAPVTDTALLHEVLAVIGGESRNRRPRRALACDPVEELTDSFVGERDLFIVNRRDRVY